MRYMIDLYDPAIDPGGYYEMGVVIDAADRADAIRQGRAICDEKNYRNGEVWIVSAGYPFDPDYGPGDVWKGCPWPDCYRSEPHWHKDGGE